MFFVLTVLIVLFGLWCFWRISTGDDGVGIFGSAAVAGIVMTCFYLIFVVAPTEGVKYLYRNYTEITVPIYEMGDSLGTKGRVFLGGGSIGPDPSFMYYAKDTEGYLRLRYISADRVRIVETDKDYPHYVKTCDDFSDTPGWLRAPFWQSYETENCDNEIDRQRTFYIPVGSVAGNFELDAS